MSYKFYSTLVIPLVLIERVCFTLRRWLWGEFGRDSVYPHSHHNLVYYWRTSLHEE